MSLLRPAISIDDLNPRGSDYLPGYLGIEITTLAASSLTSRMPVRKLHFAPNDFLHAASVVSLADTTCGYATIAHLPEGAQSFTTIEIKEGSIACVATAQHLGKTTQVWDAVVTDEASGRKIALFRCTQMILWPKSTGSESRPPPSATGTRE